MIILLTLQQGRQLLNQRRQWQAQAGGNVLFIKIIASVVDNNYTQLGILIVFLILLINFGFDIILL